MKNKMGVEFLLTFLLLTITQCNSHLTVVQDAISESRAQVHSQVHNIASAVAGGLGGITGGFGFSFGGHGGIGGDQKPRQGLFNILNPFQNNNRPPPQTENKGETVVVVINNPTADGHQGHHNKPYGDKNYGPPPNQQENSGYGHGNYHKFSQGESQFNENTQNYVNNNQHEYHHQHSTYPPVKDYHNKPYGDNTYDPLPNQQSTNRPVIQPENTFHTPPTTIIPFNVYEMKPIENTVKPHEEKDKPSHNEKTPEVVYTKPESSTTKKPDNDDEPLFIALTPEEYKYDGENIKINAPKRDTNGANEDGDEYAIDIRFKDQ